MYRSTMPTLLFVAVVLAACLNSPEPVQAASDRSKPNLIVILADDVGVEALGCYGGTTYNTPHLDALARTGKRFQHCYSMPVCHPTRVTLLTGQYPSRLGRPGWGSFPKEKNGETFARVLKKAGYATAVAGKWQLTLLRENPDHPQELGFEESCLFGWHEGPRYHEPLIWQNGKIRDDVKDRYGPDVYCDFLIDFMRRNQDRPFLAFYSMALCHAVTDDLKKPVPYSPGKDRYDSFHEMVEAMDGCVGRIVSAVDRLGLRENTLILFTGDNGSPRRSIIKAKNGKYLYESVVSMRHGRRIPGGKGKLTNGGTHVPLIANWRGTIQEGTVHNALIDMSDFLPTLVELAGTPLPKGVVLDGKSFAAQLLGSREQHRDWVYAESRKKYWVRTQDWKMYNDGRLFDMKNDSREKEPIRAGQGTAESAAVRAKLEAAMKSLSQ